MRHLRKRLRRAKKPDGEAKTGLISNRLNILMLTWFKEC